MTSISGYVETLHYDERMEDDAREFLDIILRNATRMHRLIEDLTGDRFLPRRSVHQRPVAFGPGASSLKSLAARCLSFKGLDEPGRV